MADDVITSPVAVGGMRSATDRVARALTGSTRTLSVAESLTGGMLTSQLAVGTNASEWFLGGIVAYTRETKQRVLATGDGPLVSERTAREMADGVTQLFGSDVAMAVTGAAGPDGHDGAEPGDVWIALRIGPETSTHRCDLNGEPETICQETCAVALALLSSALE